MKYMLSRLFYSLVVLWIVATILFFMFRLMPGTPLAAFIDNTTTKEQQDAIIAQFGLDRSLFEQYLSFLANLAQGDLGQSFFHKRPVMDVVMEALPNTIILTMTGLVVAYIFGVLAGAYLAWKRGSVAEAIGIPITLATRAAPEFWLGMVLLAIFSFQLGWFPAGGANSVGMTYDNQWQRVFSWDFLRHLALPALTLAIYLQGLPLLLMRSNMIEILQEEFITMGKMKGLTPRTIVLNHAARNALLPVATAFALGVGGAIGGNVVVETIFSWPGIGRLLVNAVSASDYPLAQGAFLLITFVLIAMNFIADMTYHLLDPRIRLAASN
ncbi:binding-protein-dependent transport systems inner membrane component (plasmid) [Ketogulonicigenium vulgare Y25]|uniref:ABC-type dipeptide/oligopeptide/nickel transport system, permease component n=1 Tax=Ketogulonicigenium vulgare (strain WSH-001) TaxID=759362 RepID=F9YBS1_KETVW|nr:ABC transporter permease [Ketogulonicigenium vulgare]ADO44388.1 binding-protein-dependent transport systems inner membrane component [Ketogulonicigenium vulgare Y25]AEM42823.1 ABC-type dipeptide/oligopeptide/nickel transport system, permease component [Ketogulonicigenium vulgare WSH-001]ALJ82748.1 peptide ABC transporter permease [Ketogulonicigenium vulgare]